MINWFNFMRLMDIASDTLCIRPWLGSAGPAGRRSGAGVCCRLSRAVFTLLLVVAAATVLTNIIVQVLKQVTWDLFPTNLLAFLVAQAITLTAFFAVMEIRGVSLTWYFIAAAVVLGLIVAYAAMFGFDKLKELLTQLGGIQDKRNQL